jgi:hypothetical protein
LCRAGQREALRPEQRENAGGFRPPLCRFSGGLQPRIRISPYLEHDCNPAIKQMTNDGARFGESDT